MIKIQNLGLQLGTREIFSDLTFDVPQGEKIGITGGEGSGKSSLLDIIARRLLPTSGSAKVSGKIIYVAGNISSDFSELRMAEMSAIEKLKRKLRGLNDEEIILLLDEPTKNLESEGVEWLIKFILTRPKLTVVAASNDRYFINRISKKNIRLGKNEVPPIKFTCSENFPPSEPDDITLPVVVAVEKLARIRDSEPLFKHISFIARQGQKIALTGRNKKGRSKLIKTLLRAFRNEPDDTTTGRGTIDFGENIRVGHMPKVFTGASAKTELENLQKLDVNLLLLDNPTNCLDLPMIEELEKALVEFPGTIIFTDEDRTFVNRIANRIMEIATDGMVDRISGYEEFLANETVLQQIREKYNPGE